MNTRTLQLFALSLGTLLACGDDGSSADGDDSSSSGQTGDETSLTTLSTTQTTVDDSGSESGSSSGVADSSSGTDDGGSSSESESGSGSESGGEVVEPTVIPLPIDAGTPDQLFTAAFADDDTVFAVGVVDDVIGGDANRSSVVVKLNADGTLDDAFGVGGIAVFDIADGGTQESVRGVVVQSSGRVVVAGVAEHDPTAPDLLATDTDIVLFAVDPITGELDTTFGDEGIRIFDPNDAVEGVNGRGTPVLNARDALWSLAVDGDDQLLLHGGTRNDGDERTDTDWLVIRTDADGALVEGFADGGMFTLDIDEANGSARNGRFLADGSILCGGYAATLSSGGITSPVAYKLTPEGELDESFGVLGVFHEVVLAGISEIYDLAPQGDSFVTAGYGRNDPDAPLDALSLRLGADGQIDASYGDSGSAIIDVAGFADQVRTVLVLPDDGVLLLGNSTETEGDVDGFIAARTVDGAPDETFAPAGVQVFDIGGTNDTINGGVISPDGSLLFMVARKGYANDFPQTETENQDAAIVLLPLGR
ncbi:MAG: hypothetical protein IAG13_14350 [Deltaproteobacteria bacterium]|nr:hypothetical protein [Nannocystaceae bacterium]